MESTARDTPAPDVASTVRAHEHREALSALCFDVLWRQAGARTATASRKYTRARAKFHRVQRREANTPLGNVLDCLLRGPEEGPEADLVCTFMLYALGRVLDIAGDQGRADEFVRRADWLAFGTAYEPFRTAADVMSKQARACLAEALMRSLQHSEFGARPLGLMRLEALAELDPERERIAKLSVSLDDPVLVAVARVLSGRDVQGGGGASDSGGVHVRDEGRVGDGDGEGDDHGYGHDHDHDHDHDHGHGHDHGYDYGYGLGDGYGGTVAVFGTLVEAPAVGGWRVLEWLTGFALLRRIVEGVGWLFGYRKTAGIWVEGASVRCERITSMLGRRVHLIDESLSARDVQAVSRDLRRPGWVAVLGVVCLLAGVVALGVCVDTALRDGTLGPAAVGLALFGLGAGTDLLLDHVLRRRGPSVWLELCAPGRPPVRIKGLDPDAAAEVVHAIGAAR